MKFVQILQRRLYGNGFAWRRVLLAVSLLSALYSVVPSFAQTYQGFGADTPGGEGQPVYHVTNLNDFGPGSLREAVSQGNRTVAFDVGGEIVLSIEIKVKGAFITIDGFTAPSPITLVNDGLVIDGDEGAHDIIVRGLRVRNAKGDSITIRDGAHHVIIDHISSQGANDAAVDITHGASDVTIQWSLFAENGRNNFLSAVGFQALRVSYHHNLFVKGQSRNPQSAWDSTLATTAPEIVTDIRNNLIWDFSAYGTVISKKTKANVVSNFYYSSLQPSATRALNVLNGSRVYAEGNYSQNGANVDGQGNEQAPFLAVSIDTTDACTAAHDVLADAGVTPRDAVDQQYLAAVSLESCVAPNPTLEVSPDRLDFSAALGGSNPSPKTLNVTSSNGSLSWNATPSATWLSVSPASGTTPSDLTVTANSSGLPQGTHLATISITAPGAENSPLAVPVSLTVSPAAMVPQITAPNPGSVLPGSVVTFTWTANGTNVRNWRLYVGSAQGARDLHDSGTLNPSRTSREVRRLPTDGRTIWARLRFDIGGTWQFADFQYTAALQ
jgi:pectate lyase